jgi:hypothetical protein
MEQTINSLGGEINSLMEFLSQIGDKDMLGIALTPAEATQKIQAQFSIYKKKAQIAALERAMSEAGSEEVTAQSIEQIINSAVSAKEIKIAEIKAYDASSSVNEFFISGHGVWITPAERGASLNFLNAKAQLGAEDSEEITYSIGGTNITTTITQAKAMLAQIEAYAGDCAIVTGQHIAAAKALATDAEIEAYDYTVGYPAKLSYSL